MSGFPDGRRQLAVLGYHWQTDVAKADEEAHYLVDAFVKQDRPSIGVELELLRE